MRTESTGLGDTVHNLIEMTGLDILAEIYTSVTGRDCGCTARQERLNDLFPYNRSGTHSTEGD